MGDVEFHFSYTAYCKSYLMALVFKEKNHKSFYFFYRDKLMNNMQLDLVEF